MNNKLLNMTLRLTIICAVAALVLGIVNIVTEPIIIERKKVEQEKALTALSDGDHVGEAFAVEENETRHKSLVQSLISHEVIAEGEDVNEKELIYSIYPVDKDGKIIKYIVHLQGKGYGGKMILLAVYNTDGSFVKAKLMENNETPGLGKKAEDSDYYTKYKGTGSENNPVPVSKRDLSDKDAESISGSTITYDGISKALALASDYVKLLGGEN